MLGGLTEQGEQHGGTRGGHCVSGQRGALCGDQAIELGAILVRHVSHDRAVHGGGGETAACLAAMGPKVGPFFGEPEHYDAAVDRILLRLRHAEGHRFGKASFIGA